MNKQSSGLICLALALLILLCSGCTFVSILKMSGAPADATHPALPANEAVKKLADLLVTNGLKKANPDTFGQNGRYDFHVFQEWTFAGLYNADEYLSLYSGNTDTVLVEDTRISDNRPVKFTDQEMAAIKARIGALLLQATGNKYNVVVIQHN